MRYNVAVKSLLLRLGPKGNILATDVPPSLFRQLAVSTLKECQWFATNWKSELSSEQPRREPADGASANKLATAFPRTRWGSLSDQLPTFLLYLELARRDTALYKLRTLNERLLASLLYNIPRPHCSLQVYGLYRALILSILPPDLRTATSTTLFTSFATLSAIKVIHEETSTTHFSGSMKPLSNFAATDTQNQAVAAAVARLPPWLKVHFAIQDDAPLLRQLCVEFTRRLPASGESLPGDYAKTLIEGRKNQHGKRVGGLAAYLFSEVQASSTTHRVTREEFVMFMSKLALVEAKSAKLRFVAEIARRDQFTSSFVRVRQPQYYTEAGAAAITNTLSHLYLLNNTAEVVAARPLDLNEWIFLISTSASDEVRWANLVLPATRTALSITDAQRVQRNEERRNNGFGDAMDTIFPELSDTRRWWLLRNFIGALFALRDNSEQLCRVSNACLPLLWEYARELCRGNLTVIHMFESLNIMQALWVVTRLFWFMDAKVSSENKSSRNDSNESRARDDEDEGSGNERDTVPPSSTTAAGATAVTSKLMEPEMLAVAGAIVHALEECLQRNGVFSVARTPSTPAAAAVAVPQTEKTSLEAPKHGAGFARSVRVPPARRPSVCPVPPSSHERKVELQNSLAQLLLEAQLSYCSLIIERKDQGHSQLREAVATALRVLPIANMMSSAELDKIRCSVEQEMQAGNTICEHGTHHQERYRALSNSGTRLSAHMVREIDIYTHQKPTFLRVINNLLQITGDHALSNEERCTVIQLFTMTVKQAHTFFLVMKHAQFVHNRSERIAQGVWSCYIKHVQPRLARDDADLTPEMVNLLHENRGAVRQLACSCLETAHHVWSFSSAFSLSSLRGVSAASTPAASFHFDSQLNVVRLADTGMSLGTVAGLTSEELPHLISTLHRSFDTLAACARQQPTSVNSNSNSGNRLDLCHTWSNKTLPLWALELHHLCVLGVYDADCLTAATEALRCCGVEENIKAMTNRQRYQFLFNVAYCFRALAPRYPVSRECRHLLHQILVVAARMTLERLAYEGLDGRFGENSNSNNTRPEKMVASCGHALLMWQIASTATVNTLTAPSVDRSISALLQYAKRHLVIPTPPGLVAHTSPSMSPSASLASSAAHLDRCELVLRSFSQNDFVLNRTTPPQTEEEYIRLCNMLIRTVVESSKQTYRKLVGELHNNPTASQRLRWQAQMEIFATVIHRFRGYIAPTLWNRIARESITIHGILTFSNLYTSIMLEVLVLSIEQVLLYSEAHNNTGTWDSGYNEESAEARPRAAYYNEYLYEAARTQLIPYHRAARYLTFQEHLTNMERRIYLVELTDRLTTEVAVVERSNEVPLFPKSVKTITFEGQKEAPATVVTAARTQLLEAFRRTRL